MYIKLVKEWMGYWRGSVINIDKMEAERLIKRNLAFPASSSDYIREIKVPPLDKMVRREYDK